MRKNSFLSLIIVVVMSVAAPVNATVYNDATGEALDGHAHLDIVSVEVSNDAADITFTITLSGDPLSTDWGKYLIGIDNIAAGDTTGNGWGRPISMPSGMDYFVGCWVDSGGGAETYSWDGSVWNKDNATYEPPSDIAVPVVTTDSVTLTTSLASLGLSGGGSFVFDVFTSGGGGGDSATDALSDPSQTITGWSGPYSSTSSLSYTVILNKAYSPVPADGQIVGVNLAELNWTNPDPNSPFDTITVDAYILDAGLSPLSQDPNLGPDIIDPYVVQLADGDAIDTLVLGALPASVGGGSYTLVDDHYYYWAVHCIDPNSPGSPATATGDVWNFYTGDASPVVGKPVDQYMWLGQDDSAIPGGDGPSNIRYFQVTATYTDDGKSPIVDANFVNLNWGWDPENGKRGVTEVSDVHTPGVGGGTVTAIYKTEYNAADPNYTTDLPGLWNIRLEVTDGTGTVQGDTGYHRITETCGQAAAEDPEDDYDGYYDTNGDCIVNLDDFAEFAAKWLYKGEKYD